MAIDFVVHFFLQFSFPEQHLAAAGRKSLISTDYRLVLEKLRRVYPKI
jgi:hypothetical protein